MYIIYVVLAEDVPKVAQRCVKAVAGIYLAGELMHFWNVIIIIFLVYLDVKVD